MHKEQLIVTQSDPLKGEASLFGAKNAVLVIMASLILTKGRSMLRNVPYSADVSNMIRLLESLGAHVHFDFQEYVLSVDTTTIDGWTIDAELMQKMRASVLVMGPLLARLGRADMALPGGCVIGSRPIDYHLTNFKKMGVVVTIEGSQVSAHVEQLYGTTIIFDYPSVGATENSLMAATLAQGKTRMVNAALEPEVMDLIAVLGKMGARITIIAPATIEVEGVKELFPIEHTIIADRLEAGSLLLAAAITGGSIELPQAPASMMEIFLMKLRDMGHRVEVGKDGVGVSLVATSNPRAVSFKTGPYPGFPTDLQAPMMAVQCVAEGVAVIEETVYENRLLHVQELIKMGADITVEHNKAIVRGVQQLHAADVEATDIRASCALVLAGLVAQGTTVMQGVAHWKRGYDALDDKLRKLGARITLTNGAE